MMSAFPPLDGFNETDLREEVSTSLLHLFGYRSGTDANIIREQSLRYRRGSSMPTATVRSSPTATFSLGCPSCSIA
jgi:hypothetical protein